jgi:hypothetical protein
LAESEGEKVVPSCLELGMRPLARHVIDHIKIARIASIVPMVAKDLGIAVKTNRMEVG